MLPPVGQAANLTLEIHGDLRVNWASEPDENLQHFARPRMAKIG